MTNRRPSQKDGRAKEQSIGPFPALAVFSRRYRCSHGTRSSHHPDQKPANMHSNKTGLNALLRPEDNRGIRVDESLQVFRPRAAGRAAITVEGIAR